MTRLELEIDGQNVEATYKTIFRHYIETELITPYKGLKVEFVKADEDCNLFIESQAEEFVIESLCLLMKQIQNVIKYRIIYQSLYDDYKRLTDIMWSVLRETECSVQRFRFRYHIALQSRVREEFERELQQQIPEIMEENRHEYFIYPTPLSKILSAI